MAKHYYNIELVVSHPLEEDIIMEVEEVIRLAVAERTARVSTEYVDSEG